MVDVLSRELPPADTRRHAAVAIRAGGTAVNVAAAAARAGAAATVVGRVGSDPAAELVLATLAQHGVESRLARDPELRTGAAVSLGTGVVADRGANAALALGDIPDPLAADALFVSGFALLQSGSRDAAGAALTRFRGNVAAVDLASPALAGDADLSGITANVLFSTAEEARAVTGRSPEAAVQALREHFDVVCIKLGQDGAIAAQGDRLERAAAEPVERASSFGAGDAFAGTFLVALARGDSLQRALTLACEAGSRAVAYMPMA